MKFGPLRVEMALGAIIAHAVHHENIVLKKGEVVRLEHIAALQAAFIDEIVVAKLEAGDVGEDAAALELAQNLAGNGVRLDRPFTGRVNVFAQHAGVLRVDEAAVDAVNCADEAISFASLPDFRAVQAGEMVGTVKIIPFSVPRAALDVAKAGAPLIEIAPFKPLKVIMISTLLPGLKPSVVAKTIVTMQKRLDIAGAKIVEDIRVPHEAWALAGAIAGAAARADLVIVFGASAITDRRDVIPAALEQCGGVIEQFGMPVDPGNLLLLGRLGAVPVLGAPGCARSPKENGFDWVLQRLLAGVPVSARDIRRMGVGGLLMEIVSRPQPRLGGENG